MNTSLIKDAILRVGEVIGIEGRRIYIEVDKNKNASELLFDGEVLKNVSVGSYIEIRKGFLCLIGKVEGEKLEINEEYFHNNKDKNQYQKIDKNKRTLTISLSGYIATDGRFTGGIKELPLIGNEAFILTESKIQKIHNLLKIDTPLKVNIAKTDIEEIPISFPIDGLFNSHIAIFGNTGSGKSNTLASLYQEMIKVLSTENKFKENCRFFIFDFNGEYSKDTCITPDKKVYNLSTRRKRGRDTIPMTFNDLMDIETLSILLEATEKTQKPFLKRALEFYTGVKNGTDYFEHFKNILKLNIENVLLMANKDIAYKIIDYIEIILSFFIPENELQMIQTDIDFHGNKEGTFKLRKGVIDPKEHYFNSEPDKIKKTKLYKTARNIDPIAFDKLSELNQFKIFLHLKLVYELQSYKVQFEHILPLINRFDAKQKDIEATFKIKNKADIWSDSNVIVINLHDVNLDMRKTIPLLLAKNIYNNHKQYNNKKSLSIIIDEAHNILSTSSFRETEDWKDYRLETFEEIIKEGRKFGVFVTIASQRPNDISETIISQAHNYFIHQLINQRDLNTVGNAVSYIDRVTEESIPTLPVGVCIFSGVSTAMPLKIRIKELPDENKPKSTTLRFNDVLKDDGEVSP